ncbi:hypothetical protein E3U23_07645 [Erythrobacter litoralis]|uniref:DUF4136 domain-containing protein n=1 Tax=Erythrobacter litoralis TaxID=39960 RepID=UPI002434DD9A|nr:DUF4136 domain-containing protein [Erythrobacter litoralis]MDG6079062.1 hypothetical protein [Erythrobacter litoralis]
MKRIAGTASLMAAALGLGACATQYTGPVEVTRFVGADTAARLGSGPVFVEAAAGDASPLALSPYTAAVAQELQQLGYNESARTAARQIAEVRLERYQISGTGNRSPVSVGVGGSTGTFGSGAGLGLGINLGGGQRDRIGTQLAVTIRDAVTGQSLWEGRADFQASDNSPLASGPANAQTVAAALFEGFPGNNGETIEVEVSE